jgi:hypothetical protein
VRRRQRSYFVPVDTIEEWMCFDLIRSISSETLIWIADQPMVATFNVRRLVLYSNNYNTLPSDEVFRLSAQWLIIWEIQRFAPVHNFTVGLMRIFRAEWWVSAKALKHDSPKRPPITFLTISLLQENLWSNIIWRSDC